MSRAVVLICTNDGEHEPVDLYEWSFNGAEVEPGEYVTWTPVFRGSTLELTCKQCPRVWWFGHDRNWFIGGLERLSRTAGRVEFDLSRCKDLDSEF